MTDVNIAVEILSDAYDDKFDRALIISGDGDLVPPIRKVASMGKRVTVAFPPRRISYKLRDVANDSLIIGRGNLSKGRFPQTVRKPNGFELTCPVKWT